MVNFITLSGVNRANKLTNPCAHKAFLCSLAFVSGYISPAAAVPLIQHHKAECPFIGGSSVLAVPNTNNTEIGLEIPADNSDRADSFRIWKDFAKQTSITPVKGEHFFLECWPRGYEYLPMKQQIAQRVLVKIPLSARTCITTGVKTKRSRTYCD